MAYELSEVEKEGIRQQAERDNAYTEFCRGLGKREYLKPEPSRLEIAAQIAAALLYADLTKTDAQEIAGASFIVADALIKANKEFKET